MTGACVVLRQDGLARWPETWAERVRGWSEGAAYRMDWPRPQAPDVQQQDAPAPLVGERDPLGQPALIGPDRAGRRMAFSARAVNQARACWEHFGVHRLASQEWHISWLNGVRAGGRDGYRSPKAAPGADVMDLGDLALVFVPEVLGPLGTLSGSELNFSPSPGLIARPTDGGILIRGAAVLDGWWRHTFVEPFSGEEGWLFLPVPLTLEEE